MADTKPKKRRKLKEAEAVETEPDAWERFKAAVHKIAPPKRKGKSDNRGAGSPPPAHSRRGR